MRILVTADLHNDFEILYKIIEILKKEKIDYLIILGDFSSFGDLKRGIIRKIINYINPEKVLIVPGNHETPDFIEFLERLYNIRGFHKKYMILDNIALVGIGGGDLPLFMISESEIKDFLKYISYKLKNYKIILFSHLPPAKTKTTFETSGSYEIVKFIEEKEPSLVIHGHIHELGGLDDIIKKTKIINAARSIFIIELDRDKFNIRKI